MKSFNTILLWGVFYVGIITCLPVIFNVPNAVLLPFDDNNNYITNDQLTGSAANTLSVLKGSNIQ